MGAVEERDRQKERAERERERREQMDAAGADLSRRSRSAQTAGVRGGG